MFIVESKTEQIYGTDFNLPLLISNNVDNEKICKLWCLIVLKSTNIDEKIKM